MPRGKLYLIPMPIGNDKDITLRSLEQLKMVDYILSEDTRDAKIILAKYQISAPLISYHLYNEKEKLNQIIELMADGNNLALISDAGMPLISDPGYLLVKKLIELNFQIIALPGANAGLTALIASGLNTEKFIFFGFIASKGNERHNQIKELQDLPYTFILYEAPHRLLKTLNELMLNNMGNRKIAIGRELTKKYENYLYTDIINAYQHFQEESPRGEFVLIIEGSIDYLKRNPNLKEEQRTEELYQLKEDITELLTGGMKVKAISNFLAKKTKFNKNEIYQLTIDLNDGSREA